MFEQTDTHVHVFDPLRFPYASHRAYTPAAATTTDLMRHLDRVGCGRVVCIQPSIYGVDNSCLLDALSQLNMAGIQARGSVVIDRSVTWSQLQIMHDAGVRSARINWVVREPGQQSALEALGKQLRDLHVQLSSLDWSIELFASSSNIKDIAPELAKLGRNIVLDHYALLRPGDEAFNAVSMATLLDCTPNLYLKLSAPYQVSTEKPDYGDLDPMVRTLAASSSKQLLWGSNWPHTSGQTRKAEHNPDEIEQFRVEDDARILRAIKSLVGSEEAWQSLMVSNPSRLFGF
jgi:2-pyrone-4,6-dicarboxylate lactonase